MKKQLIKLANHLNANGHKKEAEYIYYIIRNANNTRNIYNKYFIKLDSINKISSNINVVDNPNSEDVANLMQKLNKIIEITKNI